MSRSFEVIVWGSTGFTGQLVCSYLSKNYPNLKWAIAGRTESKLLEVKTKLNLSVPVLIADISSPESLDNVFKQTKVVLSTAGPFAKIGTPIVESCVRSSTNYCDITGEAQWVRTIIDQFHEEAQKKNLKIVNCCGFDCVPCDLATQMIVEEMQNRTIEPKEVRLTVMDIKGGASGGTLASVFNLFETSSFSTLKQLTNPFFLCPRDPITHNPIEPTNPNIRSPASDSFWFSYDRIEGTWVMPWVMQAIDTRIVNRSNALLPPSPFIRQFSSSSSKEENSNGWGYGRDLLYSERLASPKNSFLIAMITSFAFTFCSPLFFLPFFRSICKYFLPKQGEGPSIQEMENGHMIMHLWGKGIQKPSKEGSSEYFGKTRIVRGTVKAMRGDPGYKETAKMISEAAVALARGGVSLTNPSHPSEDSSFWPLSNSSGVLTPATALGTPFRMKLSQIGIEFSVLPAH